MDTGSSDGQRRRRHIKRSLWESSGFFRGRRSFMLNVKLLRLVAARRGGQGDSSPGRCAERREGRFIPCPTRSRHVKLGQTTVMKRVLSFFGLATEVDIEIQSVSEIVFECKQTASWGKCAKAGGTERCHPASFSEYEFSSSAWSTDDRDTVPSTGRAGPTAGPGSR